MARRKLSRKEQRQLAAELERHKGDVSTWSKRPVRARISNTPGVLFSVRLGADELDELRRRAAALNMSSSEFVRRLLSTLKDEPSPGVEWNRPAPSSAERVEFEYPENI
jgi:hypothetical protein